jgi:hypothetical protein
MVMAIGVLSSLSEFFFSLILINKLYWKGKPGLVVIKLFEYE